MAQSIDNTEDIIDSRDVIARIEDLEDTLQAEHAEREENGHTSLDYSAWLAAVADSDNEAEEHGLLNYCDEASELRALLDLQDEAESSPDWIHGATLINRDYFVEYIEDMIRDCYQLPKEMLDNSNEWPWKHLTIDYEAAAGEAEQDYNSVDFDGNEYLIRA